MDGCVGNGTEALFTPINALSSEAGVRSVPEWSLSPCFERTWASLSKALEDGWIDAERLREGCVPCAPLPAAGSFVFLGVDTSTRSRPEADRVADRTRVPIATLSTNVSVACPGLLVSHVVLLPPQAGPGTAVLDTARRAV
jgi:hypothetical protein